MYGAFSGISFGIVVGAALLVIALAVFASPLFAVIIFLVVAVALLLMMAAQRQRSRGAEQGELSEPGTGPAGPRARGTGGRRSTGEPASGEG
jgi:membrane protein implicated in regulation of membrane protease activity